MVVNAAITSASHLGDGRQAVWHVGEFQAGRGGQVAGELARNLRGDVASME